MKKVILDENSLEKIVSEYNNGVSSSSLAVKYKLSPSTILRFLKKNKVPIRGNNKKLDENIIIEMYISNLYTVKDICDKFNISKNKVRNVLLKNNIVSKSSKKYNYNCDIFSNIDTQDKSYWLGFLYADGYVRQRNKIGSELKLKLSIKDQEHLIKFKNFISSDDLPISYEEYRNSKNCKISINSKKIVNDLINNGCINKKSKIILFPNLKEDMIRHFIRGYFDGDGSISHGKSICLNMISGSYEFLQSVSDILHRKAFCKKATLVGRSKNFKYIQYSTKEDLLKIYNYLYNDSCIYLNRKKDKFAYILENYEELKLKINQYDRNRYKTKNDRGK